MPLTLTLTEGVLPENAIPQAVARLTDAFLEQHGLAGNEVMTRNVTVHVNILPKGTTFAGGEEIAGAWIETKTPSFALADPAVKSNFFMDATRIIHTLSGGKLPVEHIWSNAVHTVDGTWNIDGQVMTNSEIGEALSKG
ncbi:MAG: hypothetical protein KGJ32_12875 [Xanthomonadaceae bacterium]|nr:hypothetical protein [Xanthomonadaceae bacterium]